MANSTCWVTASGGKYPVRVGRGLLAGIGPALRTAGFQGRVAVVSDATVLEAWGPVLLLNLESSGYSPEVLSIVPGEASKTVSTAELFWGRLIEAGFGRSDVLLACGGGVVGDLGGFVAATLHRGMRLLQVPTTLLAQVDSSIGGKVAVDHRLGKNLVGAFYPPEQVVADVETLTTLPARERWNGLAEVVKVALVRDAHFVAELEGELETLAEGPVTERTEAMVAHAAQLKAAVVSADEREGGERMLLNLGHTLGHALEAATGYAALSHGEAVVVGMKVAVRLSRRMGLLPEADEARTLALLNRFPRPLGLLKPSVEAVRTAALRDKKAVAGTLRYVVLRGVGQGGVEVLAKERLDEAVELALETL
jgi:3-dehydroquinate synthase